MNHDSVPRFALSASAVTLAAGALVLPSVAAGPSGGWAVLGWIVSSSSGLLSGAVLAGSHGRPGSRFVAALGGGIALRMLLFASVVVTAALVRREALVAALIGLGVGYVAVQVFEMVWFFRRSGAA